MSIFKGTPWDGHLRKIDQRALSAIGVNPYAMTLIMESPYFRNPDNAAQLIDPDGNVVLPCEIMHQGRRFQIVIRADPIP